ncbi:hypothetical protein QZH41_017712, partial [Actinostola sp. cb2023]
RMMPSIPTPAAAAINQPSALVRPSRHSTSSVVPRSPRLEAAEESSDSQGGSNIVKGLLKSMRTKSPVSPRHVNKPQTTTATMTTVAMTVDHDTVMEESKKSPPLSANNNSQNTNDSASSSPSTDVNSPRDSAVTTTFHKTPKLSDKSDSPRTSPTQDISSPKDSMKTSAHAHILSDKSNSPRSSPTQDISSPRESMKTSARARILSDKTAEQKSRKLTRCVSEADLTTKRPRSRTVGSTPSKSSSNATKILTVVRICKDRRHQGLWDICGIQFDVISGMILHVVENVLVFLSSSLSIKDEQNTKPQRDEPTRLYIRGRSLNLYPPSDFVEDKRVGLPPDQKLQLEWVIALHPNQLYVASGQVAGHDKDEGRPHVRVWDSITLDTLQVLGIGQFERAISCLAFTIQDNGRHLVVVDESNEHAISHWDWKNKRLISENKASSDPVFMTVCHPRDLSIIVSCGKSHIAFWTVLESGGLMKKMGVYGTFDKPRFVLCICFLTDGNLLSGDSNGNIFEWPQGTNHIGKAVIGAHEGAVFSLCALDDGGFLSGGGRDRLIVLWNESYQPLKEFELPESAGPVRSIARSLDQENDGYELAVGTTRNSILTGTFDDGLAFMVAGHTDELWGLAVHPTRRMFVTCAYDKQIMLCNADNHTTIWKKQFEESLQSAAFHPKTFVLAIGTQSGNWMVLDSITGDQLGAFHDGPEQLDAIKYSPDGKYIAVGSHDNFIYIYTVSEDGRTYRRHGKLSGHSSFITHLDWSDDSQYLQSNSGDYEILYWNAHRCKQVVSAYSMRDIKWKTWTCVLGFPACGIWPEGADGTDINASCRSTSSEFLVTGDDFGQVNFFRFPVTKLKSDCQNCVGHSSHVTCVRFTCDDTRVISTGGKDCSIMQWKIIN